MTLPGTASVGELQWTNGDVDFKVELATIPSKGEGAVWDADNWDEDVWVQNIPEWTDVTGEVLSASVNFGTERWGTRIRDASAQIILKNDSGIFNPDAGREDADVPTVDIFRSDSDLETMFIQSDLFGGARFVDGFVVTMQGRFDRDPLTGLERFVSLFSGDEADQVFNVDSPATGEIRFNIRTDEGIFEIRTTRVFLQGDIFTLIAEYVPGGGFVPGFLTGAAETSDKALLDVSGDIDVGAVVELSTGTVLGKWAAADRSYRFGVTVDQNLEFEKSPDGTAVESAVSTTPVVGSGFRWIRAQYDQVLGTVTFYTSTDPVETELEFVEWFQLGGVVPIGDSETHEGALTVRVGENSDGSDSYGDLIYGVLLLGDEFVPPGELEPGFLLLDGVDQYVETDSVATQFPGALDLIALVAPDVWAAGFDQTVSSRKANGVNSWRFDITTSGTLRLQWYDPGSNIANSGGSQPPPSAVDGEPLWIRATIDPAIREIRWFESTDPVTTPRASVVWTEFGTVRSGDPTDIEASDATIRGGWSDGVDGLVQGRVYGLWGLDGIDGTEFFSPDWRVDQGWGTGTGTDTDGNVWTLVNGAVWTPPSSIDVLFEDDFTGVDDAAWDPVKWPVVTVDDAVFSIQGNRGDVVTPASADASGSAVAAASSMHSDAELRVDVFAPDAEGASVPKWVYFCLRSSGDVTGNASRPSTCWYFRVPLNRAQSGILYSRLLNSEVQEGATPQTNYDDMSVRFQVVGDQIRAKVWEFGTEEPGSWDIDITNNRIPDPGVVQVVFRQTDPASSFHGQIDDLVVVDNNFTPFQVNVPRADPDFRTDRQGWSTPPGVDDLDNSWALLGVWTPPGGGAGEIRLRVDGVAETPVVVDGILNISSTEPLTVFNRTDRPSFFRSTVEAEFTGILSDYRADARLQDGFEVSLSGVHGLNTDQGWLFNIAATTADETFAFRFQNDRLRFTVRTADDTFTIQSTQVFADGDEFVVSAEYDPVVGEITLEVNDVIETPVAVTGLLNLAGGATRLAAFQRSRFPSDDRAFLGDISEATLVADGVLISQMLARDTGFGSGPITPGSDWEDDAGVEWVVGENLTIEPPDQGFVGGIRGVTVVDQSGVIANLLTADTGLGIGSIPPGFEWTDEVGTQWTAGEDLFIEGVATGAPGGKLALRPGRWARLSGNAQTGWIPLFTGTIDSMDEVYSEAADTIETDLNCTGFGALFVLETSPALTVPVGVGERTDQRVERMLDLLDQNPQERLIDEGLHTMIGTTIARSRTEEMQRAADAEGGIFYFDSGGFAVFHNLTFLETASRSVNVQYQPGSGIPGHPEVLGIVSEWEAGRVSNDVQMARVDGEATRVVSTQSQSLYGKRTYQRFDFEVDDDDQVQALAEQFLKRREYDRLTVDEATLYAETAEAAERIFNTRIGDRLRFHVNTNRGWSYAVEVWVVGIQYQVSASDWNATFRLADTAEGLPPGVRGAYSDGYSDGYVIGTV